MDDLGLLSLQSRDGEDVALVSVRAQRGRQVRNDQMVGKGQEDITGRKIREVNDSYDFTRVGGHADKRDKISAISLAPFQATREP